jgi:hypothetical protein
MGQNDKRIVKNCGVRSAAPYVSAHARYAWMFENETNLLSILKKRAGFKYAGPLSCVKIERHYNKNKIYYYFSINNTVIIDIKLSYGHFSLK